MSSGFQNQQLVETPGTFHPFLKAPSTRTKSGSKDFLKYKLIRMKDKKNLMKLFIYARALGKSFEFRWATEKSSFNWKKETVSDYLLREWPRAGADRYPCCRHWKPGEHSQGRVLATLRNLTHFKIYTLSEEWGAHGKIESVLDVRLDTPVVGIRHGKEKGVFHVETGGNTTTSHAFDKIIFAVQQLPFETACGFPVSEATVLNVSTIPLPLWWPVALSKPCPGNSMMNTFTKRIQALATVVLDRCSGNPHHRGKACNHTSSQHMGSERLLRNRIQWLPNGFDGNASLWPGLSENVLFTRTRIPLVPCEFSFRRGTLKTQKTMR